MKSILLKVSVGLTFAAVCAPNASAEPHLNLSFEAPAFIDYRNPSGEITYNKLDEDGKLYDLPEMSHDGNYQWISGSAASIGTRSLGVRVDNYTAVKRRAELRAVHRDDSYGLRFGRDDQYYGFSVYIHPNSDLPDVNTIIMQAFQDKCGPQVPLIADFLAGNSYWRLRIKATAGSGSRFYT